MTVNLGNAARLDTAVTADWLRPKWKHFKLQGTCNQMQPHATLVANSISHRILLPSSYGSLRHARSPNVIQYIKQGTRCTPGFLSSLSLSFRPPKHYGAMSRYNGVPRPQPRYMHTVPTYDYERWGGGDRSYERGGRRGGSRSFEGGVC